MKKFKVGDMVRPKSNDTHMILKGNFTSSPWKISDNKQIHDIGEVDLGKGLFRLEFDEDIWHFTPEWEVVKETKEKEGKLKLEFESCISQEEVRKHIKLCEGKHTQQVVYSTFHDALTQICYDCKKIRSNMEI